MKPDEFDTDGTTATDANEPCRAVQSWSHEATDELPSEAVLLALNSLAEDVTSIPPVYETVDLDALDAIFTGQVTGSVTFHHAGYDVVVNSNGETVVCTRR